jgi:chitodextrinase
MLETSWDEANVGTASEYQMDYEYHWAPGTAQLEWLEADLAAHPSVLKFAFFHYPIYSDNPFESASPYLVGSNRLEGLLKAHGVDLAFTGHAHIYERNLPSPDGLHNYITGGGGAPLGTLGPCTALDAYAIKFTNTGAACGSAPVPTSAAQVYHFLKVTVDGTSVRVTPVNSLGQTFDVIDHNFTGGAESTPPSVPGGLALSPASGTQVDLSWSAATDNTGVRGYGIYRNGALIDTVAKNVLEYSDTDLQPSTKYTYRVDAFDGSGNHSALSAAKTVTTPERAVYRFGPVADAYVAGDTPSTNFGGSVFLKADTSPAFQSYLRFYVGDIRGTVTKATLRLYTTSSSAVGYQVKRVNSQGWEEGEITFNNAPTPGATIGSSGSFALNNWTTVDVTSLIDGNGVYDLALTTSSTATLNFNSRNAGSNRPQLVVETTAEPAVEQGVNVSIAGQQEGSHTIQKGQALQASYDGINEGPVKLTSATGDKILGSEAVTYAAEGKRLSFSEVMGLPADQAGKVFWLPWYNNKTLSTQLRIANLGSATASVRVFIGGKEMPGSPFTVAAGASTRKSYNGIDRGPVRIVSSQNIVASQRVIYTVDNAPTSFAETLALPSRQVSKTVWFPWYNNKTLSTQLRVTNVSSSPASVRVFIGAKEMPGSPFAVAARATTRQSFAGIDKGPVRIVSSQNIVASQRVVYTVNGTPTSFSEVMGLPATQVDNVFWLPWYNNVGMDTQLRITNVGASTASVRVFVGGQEMVGSPFTLAAGVTMRQSFAGVNAGPVRIVSSRNIVVTERVIYSTAGGVPTSFSEMFGRPARQLHTTYWLPWYNNVDLNSELRLAVP